MSGEGFSMEDHLDDAVVNIVRGIVSPPGLPDRLLPPHTRIVKSKGTDYKSFTIRTGDKAVIRMGGATYRVLNALTETAATFFVTDETGRRPSSYWSAARDRLASTIDSYASPLTTHTVPDIAISPQQVTPAVAFAQYAYRFIICHELAHIALGHHFGAGGSDDTSSSRASQDEELAADSFALELQVRTLPQPEMLVTGLSAPVYFIYLLRAFDDYRLALLSNLVDYQAWQIEHSHPPYLHRIFNLMSTATEFLGENAGNGVAKVQESLGDLVERVWAAANETRDRVASEAAGLLKSSDPAAVARLDGLLRESPIGVLQALDTDRGWLDDGWPFRATIPAELTAFLALSPADRARALA